MVPPSVPHSSRQSAAPAFMLMCALQSDDVNGMHTIRYVQWIQSSGARVALLDWNASKADLQRSFDQLSGVVLTGGHCGIHGTPYGQATKAFLDMVTQYHPPPPSPILPTNAYILLIS